MRMQIETIAREKELERQKYEGHIKLLQNEIKKIKLDQKKVEMEKQSFTLGKETIGQALNDS